MTLYACTDCGAPPRGTVCCGGAQVDPQFYAFRWITLLLTQEFSCPDVTRLWDTMLSDPAGRTDSLLRLCMAMLLNLRQELLQVRLMLWSCRQPDLLRFPDLHHDVPSK